MSFSVLLILASIITLLHGRTFTKTSGTYKGSSTYDFSFLTTACAAIGKVPARIENDAQNDAALAACTGGSCWFDIVREDVSQQGWYYYGDKCAKIEYFHWYSNQPQGTEACVGFHSSGATASGTWHDIGCTHGPWPALCMEASEIEDACSSRGSGLSIHHGCTCEDSGECSSEAPYCHTIGFVTGKIGGDPGNFNDASGAQCCCRCPDCPPF